MHTEASIGYRGNNLKQVFTLTTFHKPNQERYGWDWNSRTEEEVLLGIAGEQVRLRYPDRYQKVHRLKEASQELKQLAALTITGLLPVGVFADALEEAFPEHAEAANLLRKWAEVKAQGDQE